MPSLKWLLFGTPSQVRDLRAALDERGIAYRYHDCAEGLLGVVLPGDYADCLMGLATQGSFPVLLDAERKLVPWRSFLVRSPRASAASAGSGA